MKKLRIKLTNNEFKTKSYDDGAKISSETKFCSKRNRRKNTDRTKMAVVDYQMTALLNKPFIEEHGYVQSSDLVYRIVPVTNELYRPVQVSVPKIRGQYINGKALKLWIAKMDSEYPRGWKAVPKHAIESEIPQIIAELEERGTMTLDELKELVEIDDFDEPEEEEEDDFDEPGEEEE
jgi:hypothetical protein